MHTRLQDRELSRSRRLVLGEILARNARREPERTALVFGDDSLTFAELDTRVNRLGERARRAAASAVATRSPS